MFSAIRNLCNNILALDENEAVMSAINKKQIFRDIKAIEKREKEIREYAALFNEAYAKTGDVNQSIKHVWRNKKLM